MDFLYEKSTNTPRSQKSFLPLTKGLLNKSGKAYCYNFAEQGQSICNISVSVMQRIRKN